MKTPVVYVFLATAVAGAQPPKLEISLKRAVEIATSANGNARIQLSAESLKQAEMRSGQAKAALLPNVDGSVSYQSLTRNLQAFGLNVQFPIPGFQIPAFVGPFNVFDARFTAAQSLLDMSAIRRFQASRGGIRSAREDQDAAADLVASLTAKAYLSALRARADIDVVRANIELASAVVKQAENLKAAGTGTGIEITRARVQLANERQRLIAAENDLRRAQLQLVRALNVDLGTDVELTDTLVYHPVDTETIGKALPLALETRPDFKAQLRREDTARLSASAVKYERLPSVAAFGDYGSIGTAVNHSLPTRAVGVAVKVPIFDGGRRDSRHGESASLHRQEQIRSRDLKEQIRLEVQLAVDGLRSADEQVKVAAEGLKLSESELAQARRRYDAGVANSLEVTDAQTRLARARDNHVVALYAHEAARIDFGHATGLLRRLID
ncbi:MAG: TolC family protein [Bryobacteraceae bacterium]